MATNKYSNGKVYRLVNNVDSEEYVGSTTQSLIQRKAGHKKMGSFAPHRHVYQHLNHVGWSNVEIVLIESCPCQSKEELNARERHWIDKLKPSLNKVIPLRTGKEWYEDNKDKIKQRRDDNKEAIREKKREYYEKNKEKVKENREANKELFLEREKKYREARKDKIKEYREGTKEKMKEYLEANKEKLQQQRAKYYAENKEKMKEYREANKEKIQEQRAKYYAENKDNLNARRREKRNNMNGLSN